ncbi:MAG: galactofuranosyltransferase [Muribaculaceae bacterium]|nr:galactofuranosyltransferase [Muribaculaceae bacterium]
MPPARRLCYISRRYKDRTSAGNKAKSDYEDILASMGAVNIGHPRTYGGGKLRTFAANLTGVLRACLRMRPSDVIVLQYPVKKYFTLICRIARLRGARTVALIHDLGSCRRRRLTLEQEISRLGHAHTVIATNPTMESWLLSHGLATRHTALGLHDYLSDAQPAPRGEYTPPYSVAYAGSLNMRKNSFLLHMHKEGIDTPLHLYGTLGHGYAPAAPLITEHGFTPPDTFIAHAQGHFGLVWDGSSLDECTGSFGEYLRLNTPHKSSFYLRAGLPLIVWSRSALAPIVTELGIGLTIDTLRDLPALLSSVSPDRYAAMRRSVEAAAAAIASGQWLRSALGRILAQI